jgi:hypothetical protein
MMRLQLAIGILFFVVSTVPESNAQTLTDVDAARVALDRFFEAWNQADNDAVRETLNFPHLTLFGDQLVIANGPDEFTVDFDRMTREEGWHKSSLDDYAVTADGNGKVHCLVTYSRFDAEDKRYRTAKVLYVVTEKAGHWGIQFRMPVDESTVDPSHATSRESRALLDAFFVHFNNRDNKALQGITSYPHAFLLSGGVAAARSPNELVMNFDGMTNREGWHRSTLDSAKLVAASDRSAAYEIVFGRHHADGKRYRTVPALWVVTEQKGEWGLQFRSLMPATFSD